MEIKEALEAIVLQIDSSMDCKCVKVREIAREALKSLKELPKQGECKECKGTGK